MPVGGTVHDAKLSSYGTTNRPPPMPSFNSCRRYPLAKDHLRRITIEGTGFLWRREHLHPDDSATHHPCMEQLTVYLEGHKNSFLRVEFHRGDHWEVGYPETGVLWMKGVPKRQYNLNRPAVVRAIVDHMLLNGWAPSTSSSPFCISDGFPQLFASKAPFEIWTGPPQATA